VVLCWLCLGVSSSIRSELANLNRLVSQLGSRNVRIVFVHSVVSNAHLALMAWLPPGLEFLLDKDGAVFRRFCESVRVPATGNDCRLFVLDPRGRLVKWSPLENIEQEFVLLESYFSSKRIIGDRIPNVPIQTWVNGSITTCGSVEWFSNRRVLTFAVPGAFTPVCGQNHLPGYVAGSREIRSMGVDKIGCFAVNDAHVLNAWRQTYQKAGEVVMVADGSAQFARAMGLTLDLSHLGLGVRSQRYAMLVDNGIIAHLNVESGFDVRVSDAGSMISLLSS